VVILLGAFFASSATLMDSIKYKKASDIERPATQSESPAVADRSGINFRLP
jgi:hypothetical protein